LLCRDGGQLFSPKPGNRVELGREKNSKKFFLWLVPLDISFFFLGTEIQVCTPFVFYPVSRKTLLFGSLKFEGYERKSFVTLDWIEQTQIRQQI
jgi:hypothetical protein